MTKCKNAYFKDDVIEKLKADPYGNTYLKQPCGACGETVTAECPDIPG
jgi:hypothetical protein